MDDDNLVTRIHLASGGYVRASESIGEVADLIEQGRADDGWAHVEDPRTGLAKLIRVEHVVWLEQEDPS